MQVSLSSPWRQTPAYLERYGVDINVVETGSISECDPRIRLGRGKQNGPPQLTGIRARLADKVRP